MKKRNHGSSSKEAYVFLTVDFTQSIGVEIVFHQDGDARKWLSSLTGLGTDTSGTFLTGLGKSGG